MTKNYILLAVVAFLNLGAFAQLGNEKFPRRVESPSNTLPSLQPMNFLHINVYFDLHWKVAPSAPQLFDLVGSSLFSKCENL
jgi:hypothetical protein